MGIVEIFDNQKLDARCCGVLGIRRTASLDEVKAAYRRLAYLYHPDLNPHDQNAENQLKEINVAYETLRSSTISRRSAQKKSAQKQISVDRQTTQLNEVYHTFVDALLGESDCHSSCR